jgi:2',3'-cyclic-nucleotide 2'-phosphodiesterase (5'-nucleotidase family)
VRPYVLRRVAGHTVAIIGATSETSGQWLEALGLDRPQEVIAAVGRAVEDAQRRADVIIVLSNLKRTQVEALAQAVPGIDAIVGANWVTEPAPVALPGAEGQVVFHAPGSQGKYLGILTLHLDAQGQVTSFDGHSLALTSDYADDPAMVQLMHEYATDP